MIFLKIFFSNDDVRNNTLPQYVSQNAKNFDPSAKLYEIIKTPYEEVYIFSGKEVFKIVVYIENRTISVDKLVHRSNKDFKEFNELKFWNIDYDLAEKIAENASKSFNGTFRKMGELSDVKILKHCGGGLVPITNPKIQHKNPYWTFTSWGDYKFYSVYVDAVNGKTIYTCLGYLK